MDRLSESSTKARRSSVFVLAGTVAAVLGLLFGVSVSAAHRSTAPAKSRALADAATRPPDVIHNPPLLFERGDPVTLTFDQRRLRPAPVVCERG